MHTLGIPASLSHPRVYPPPCHTPGIYTTVIHLSHTQGYTPLLYTCHTPGYTPMVERVLLRIVSLILPWLRVLLRIVCLILPWVRVLLRIVVPLSHGWLVGVCAEWYLSFPGYTSHDRQVPQGVDRPAMGPGETGRGSEG